ncbi:MAG: zinc-dependent alcohol dehydrogenase [Candidatus Binataceae bacterium]|jgi:(R,R)-butanediol dehydrogenase / meso-butanediol dehydrogenase / diacetyl reductase
MKAAVYKQPNEMAVIDVPRPVAGRGEVVLKVHACGICGSDLHAVQYGFGMPPDSVMGHEFCGEIVEIGPQVGGYAIGDRVTSLPYIGCNTCEPCVAGKGMHCEDIRGLGLGQLPGAYAEYVMCGAKSLFKLPDNVDSRLGALVEPLSVGLHGVNRSGLGPGAACVVMGGGPIGLATLLWCKAKGAATVIVSELAPGRSELARRLGATEVVNPTIKDPAERIREITGRGPDLVFECIGVKSTLESAISMVATLGRVVVLGVCMEPDEITPVRCIFKEITVSFVLGYNDAEFQETINALSQGKIDPRPMVTDVIGVDQVPEMFAALRKPGGQAKVIVEFPH